MPMYFAAQEKSGKTNKQTKKAEVRKIAHLNLEGKNG